MPTRDDETHRTERDLTTTRRRLLQTAGILGTGALAGCLGSGPGGDTTSSASDLPESASMESFTRLAQPDSYQLQYRMQALRDEPLLGLDVEKEQYGEALEASRSITDTFDEALESELSTRLAATLGETLDDAGIEDTVSRVAVVAEFVRGFEYVTDTAGTGSTEYPKYIVETLVENEGDCEDFANVIAGVYANQPFDLDPALIVYPGHVGIGLDAAAFGPAVEATVKPGEKEYLYVDSTHDVDLGVVPEEIRDSDVIATYDGGWTLHDVGAFVNHVKESVTKGYSDPSKYL